MKRLLLLLFAPLALPTPTNAESAWIIFPTLACIDSPEMKVNRADSIPSKAARNISMG